MDDDPAGPAPAPASGDQAAREARAAPHPAWAWLLEPLEGVPQEALRRGARPRPLRRVDLLAWHAREQGGQRLDRHDGGRGRSPRTAVRLPLWLHERLVDTAARERTTPSAVLREALEAHLGVEPPVVEERPPRHEQDSWTWRTAGGQRPPAPRR